MLESSFYYPRRHTNDIFKRIKEAAQPIIEDIYNDGFIQDLLAGTLSKQAVRQYLRADASYLKEFSNLYAYLYLKCLQWRMLNF